MRDLTLAVIAVVFGVLGAAYATFAMIPDTTIMGLYGDKWIGAIPLMIPFAIAMPFYGAHCLLGPILCGLGVRSWNSGHKLLAVSLQLWHISQRHISLWYVSRGPCAR